MTEKFNAVNGWPRRPHRHDRDGFCRGSLVGVKLCTVRGRTDAAPGLIKTV